MLADRDYMRGPGGRDPLSATAKLCLALVAVFALQCVNWAYVQERLTVRPEDWFGLSVTGIRRGWVWQLLTFQVLHAGFLHLLFNLLSLWWLGRYAESVMGARRMLLAFFGTGVVGGILQGVLMLAFPAIFGPVMFGASAGVCGLLAVFARLESATELRIYGVVPVKAWTLLVVLGAISLFFTLVPVDRGVAHAAHLGGLLAGLGFVKLGWHHNHMALPWQDVAERLRSLFHRPRTAPVRTPRFTATRIPRAEQVVETEDPDYIAREVDPILDKIAAHGIQSLTDRERKTLATARDKIAKR